MRGWDGPLASARNASAIAVVAIAFATALIVPGAAGAASAEDRYSLAGGCYALRTGNAFVVKAGGGYGAPDVGIDSAEPFRMQATDLGEYLLYDGDREFVAAGDGEAIEVAAKPSPAAEWRVEGVDGGFRLTNLATGRELATGDQAALVQGQPARFGFERTSGCADYPEIGVNARGTPSTGPTPYGETRGFVDAHLHLMAFEALGGAAHCGRPWHRYGVAYALPDCAEIQGGPTGATAVFQNFLDFGSPVYPHDTVGWPTFKDWPKHNTLSYEQTYYKWVERAWRAGLRMITLLTVDNEFLCKAYTGAKPKGCDEMNGIRRQIRDAYELQSYIDAQFGGPGKGWLRIVRNPFQARRVINRGKLALVLGVETSKLLNCGVYKDVPQCDASDIDRGLDELRSFGVRQMEIVNKFDNTFTGVAGDGGAVGVVTTTGNYEQTGSFFALETCKTEAHDQPAATGIPHSDLGLAFIPLVSPGDVPVYPAPPHCNVRGLTSLGEHLIRGMIKREMIFDPDHMSVVGRTAALSLIEAEQYSGLVSSHSWSDVLTYPRVYADGGFVTPYAGDSEGFVESWREMSKLRDRRYYFGFGYGADTNGLGAQGPPRAGASNPVKYPFKSFDGAVTLERQRSGEQVYDINEDGVAHYGLYADWIEDLRMIAGNKIIRDMARGPEAYLQMWERAVGVERKRCRPRHAKLSNAGLGKLRLGATAVAALKKAGQPERRVGRVYRYCVAGKRNRNAEVAAVFTRGRKLGLIASDANGHKAGGVAVGDRGAALRGAKRIGAGVYTERAKGGAVFAYVVGGGKVRTVATVSRSASSRGEILANLKLAR
jgi:hypothetical protein